MNLTDEELMKLTSRGDQKAFEKLYYRHARRFQGFFLRMLAYDSAKAEDFTQELFLRIFEKATGFEEKNSFSSWAFSIAYNLCKNEYRHQKVEEKYQMQLPDGGPSTEEGEQDMDRNQFHHHLQQAILRLPEVQRAAFTLRYQEELTVPEIAVILRIPEGTVKSRLYHAVRALAESLKVYHPCHQ